RRPPQPNTRPQPRRSRAASVSFLGLRLESRCRSAAPPLPRSRIRSPVSGIPVVLMPVPRMPAGRGEPGGAEGVEVALPRHDGDVEPAVAVEVGHGGREEREATRPFGEAGDGLAGATVP